MSRHGPGRARAAWRLGGAAAAVGLVLAGCADNPRSGYAFAGAHSDRIDTVRVDIFQNLTFSRGLEIELADAVAKEIRASTPWRVSNTESATATLSGEIVETRLTSLSSGRESGLVQEQGVTITVDFALADNRTGKVITSRRRFSASDVFIPALGVGERLETGEDAAVQRLARAIVAELRSGW
ncbi:MAG TPA: LPS assembly lipoprotein LptE [Phycisphaerales bacterium]|nr:LPS assembly lipoprotein LptE [Phycisphaerales bacterium]